jgi:hypothetical protein
MKKTRHYLGFCLHALVASVILFSAVIKFLRVSGHGGPLDGPPMPLLLLGSVELANALLLLITRTMSVEILLTSAGWGAVIALTVAGAHDRVAPMHPLVPTGFLMMTWIGGYLRDSRMLFSFSPRTRYLGETKA